MLRLVFTACDGNHSWRFLLVEILCSPWNIRSPPC